MMNIVGRNNMGKPSNVGAGVGGTCITSVGKNIVLNQQNQKSMLGSVALKDAVSIKSFKDNQNFVKDRTKSPNTKFQQNWNNSNCLSKQAFENNASFDKMVQMESFRHYNKIVIKKEDSTRGNKENDSSYNNMSFK